MHARDIAFWLLAITSVASAVGVILHRNPVRAALFLIANFICLALLYLNLNAQMLAAFQVLVYAGAIMVLFLFVIMLLNLSGEQNLEDPLAGQKGAGLLLAIVLFAGLVAAVISASRQLGPPMDVPVVYVDQVRDIGVRLMTEYVYPFELTSVLLLVGIIGAVLLAKRRMPEER